MTMTHAQIGIAACERLKIPHSHRLQLQSYVDNALSNLSRAVANDPARRRLLLTNQTAVTENVTSQSYGFSGASLSTLISTYGLMLEYLQLGTIFYIAATKTWTSVDVDTGTKEITIANHGYVTGQPVRLTTGGTLPNGLTTGVTYYLIVVDSTTLQFATTEANARAGTYISFSTTGSGTSTMTAYEKDVCQWLASPTQGQMDQVVPFDYPYIWLEQNYLYTNRTNGTFNFMTPYTPTLLDLPEQLENDLVDEVTQLYISSGYVPAVPAETNG